MGIYVRGAILLNKTCFANDNIITAMRKKKLKLPQWS